MWPELEVPGQEQNLTNRSTLLQPAVRNFFYLSKGKYSHVFLCHFSEQEALLENVSLCLCPAWFVWFLLVSNCFITVEINVMLLFHGDGGFFPPCCVNISHSYLLQGKCEKDSSSRQKLRNCLSFGKPCFLPSSGIDKPINTKLGCEPK